MPPPAPASNDGLSRWAAPTSTWNPTSFWRVFRAAGALKDGSLAGRDAPPSVVWLEGALPLPARTPIEIHCGSSVLFPAAAFAIRGVTASKVAVTVDVRFMCRVPSTIRRTLSTSPADSLMPMILGCSDSAMTISTGRS